MSKAPQGKANVLQLMRTFADKIASIEETPTLQQYNMMKQGMNMLDQMMQQGANNGSPAAQNEVLRAAIAQTLFATTPDALKIGVLEVGRILSNMLEQRDACATQEQDHSSPAQAHPSRDARDVSGGHTDHTDGDVPS